VWSAGILGARLVGLAREAALGRTLGVGGEADLYQAAFTVPDFVHYLLAGGAMAVLAVPLFAAHLARGDERGAWRSLSSIGSVLGVLLGAALVAAWFAMPWLVRIAAPGFDAPGQAELARLSRIVLPAQGFHVLGGLFSAGLLARDRHALAAFAPVVYNLVVVAVGVLNGSAEGFAWGVLAGSFAGPFLLPLAGCVRLGYRFELTFAPRHPDVRAWAMRALPIMAGFSIVVADDWFLRAHGTLLGTGAAATLGYAKALLRVPVGVVGLAAGLAAYPLLARRAAQGLHGELASDLSRALRAVVVLALVAQAALIACGTDAAALVYGRTRLGPDELAAVGDALALAALGLAAWTVQPLLARGFYALGDTWTPAVLGTLLALALWPLYGLARSAAGTAGLAATSAVAITLHALALRVALGRKLAALGATPPAGLALFFTRVLVCFGVATGAGIALERALPPAQTAGDSALHCCAVGAAVAAAFALTGLATGLSEVRGALRPLVRRPRGAPAAP
jgi:putative peptidoglycan lipid II flippase